MFRLHRSSNNWNSPIRSKGWTVAYETTLAAAHALVMEGQRPVALNFANGVELGGGFLRGATAEEETLYRSSALYTKLFGEQMYDYHRDNDVAAMSDWTILSPNVLVFRHDAGMVCDKSWLLTFGPCWRFNVNLIALDWRAKDETGKLLEYRSNVTVADEGLVR